MRKLHKSEIFSLLLGAIAGFAVWATSVPITGQAEPWDASVYYFPGALVFSGFLVGLIVPRPLWGHYVGGLLGQVIFMAVFLRWGPLALLGLVLLTVYTLFLVAGSAASAWLRKFVQ